MENIPRSPLQWPAGQQRTSAYDIRESKFGKRHNEPGNYKPMRKPTIDEATRYLCDEIRRLTGDDEFILSTNLRYRQDGLPYSNQAQPKDQGVAVYFKLDGKDTVIACDSFNKIGCNIYAIAKTIDSMRAIERYGSSQLMKQAFTGFQALPEKGSGKPWWEYFKVSKDVTEDELRVCYREMCHQLHPDKPGNTREGWDELQEMNKQGMATFKNLRLG